MAEESVVDFILATGGDGSRGGAAQSMRRNVVAVSD